MHMDQYIVRIRVAKSGTPDTLMTAIRSVPALNIKAVINRLTDELDKMEPVEEDPNAKS